MPKVIFSKYLTKDMMGTTSRSEAAYEEVTYDDGVIGLREIAGKSKL